MNKVIIELHRGENGEPIITSPSETEVLFIDHLFLHSFLFSYLTSNNLIEQVELSSFYDDFIDRIKHGISAEKAVSAILVENGYLLV